MASTESIRIRSDLAGQLRQISESSRPRISIQSLVECAVEDYLNAVKVDGISIIDPQAARPMMVAEPKAKYKTAARSPKDH